MNAAKEVYNISYGSHLYQKMDVYFPNGYTAASPVVFLVHGGGFITGSKEDFALQAELMRDEGFVTVNLSYRLVDMAGLFLDPPVHQSGPVKISDQLADVDAAVKKYSEEAGGWGSGTSLMYMAGHSAGAILAMLYVQGDKNMDNHIHASGNWAGATDLSLPGDAACTYLSDPQRSQLQELYYRAVGFPQISEHNSAFRAISPYWVANESGGKPNISIYPEANYVLNYSEEATIGLQNTRNFHALLRNRGIAEQLDIQTGANHGFQTPENAWHRCIRETAIFFRNQ